MTATAIFVGIDIAKADFVVAGCPDGPSWTATNDLEGMTVTVARLRALAPALIVLEAAGGGDTALVAAVAAASRPVVVANPREVRDVAKATGQRVCVIGNNAATTNVATSACKNKAKLSTRVGGVAGTAG